MLSRYSGFLPKSTLVMGRKPSKQLGISLDVEPSLEERELVFRMVGAIGVSPNRVEFKYGADAVQGFQPNSVLVMSDGGGEMIEENGKKILKTFHPRKILAQPSLKKEAWMQLKGFAKWDWLRFLTLFLLCWGLTAKAEVVSVATIEGTIDPATLDYLRSSIQIAETRKAEILLVHLNTPGGLVASVREMAQTIDDSKIPVVVYVSPAGASATSAGALLMLAAHASAMAPGTNIGAAHPVQTDGKEAEGAMGEKVLNDTAAFARSLAEVRGRDPALAAEFVTKSKSFTAKEAFGKKMIDLLAKDQDELFQKLSGRKVKLKNGQVTLSLKNPQIEKIEMTLGQKLLHILANPNIAAVLMTLAMLLIYVEVSNPGITLAGILGGICLLIAFMAFQVLPIQVAGVALLALGMVMMIAELFVTAKGALATGGFISFVLGLIWLVDPTKSDLQVNRGIIAGLSLGLGFGVAGLIYGAARIRKLSRETLKNIGGGGLAGLLGYEGEVKVAGTVGKVSIRGELWDFVSKEKLKLGEWVKAVKVEGFKVRVEKVKKAKR